MFGNWKGSIHRVKLGLGIALVAAMTFSLTGCGGYIEGGGYGDYNGGGYYDGDPGPDIYLFGGNYDRGRDVQGYSHRGSESRGAAHLGGGHGGGGRDGGGHGGGGHRR